MHALPRIGCFGIGWIGRHRMQSVVEEGVGQVVAVADPDSKACEEALSVAPGARVVEGLAGLLEQDLDGVMVATPSAMHAEQSIAVLRSGRAVFCQKPLGRTAQETAAVVEAARSADRLLAVDLSYRHVQGVSQMRELVRGGALGNVFAVELTFHNAYGPDKSWFYDPTRSGGGCLVDLGIHCLDLALWITGSRSADVMEARCLVQGESVGPAALASQVEDYATARLRLDGGAMATLACSWNLHAGQDAVIEAEFYGTAGSVTLRNVAGSFYDFEVAHHVRTGSERIAGPPDAWGGRAAVAWARALGRDPAFDPRAEELVELARILDRIYGR